MALQWFFHFFPKIILILLNLCVLVFLLVHSVLDMYGQQIADVYVYDSTLSRFSDYDFDDQGNLLFSGYVRPRNTTGTDPFGNLSFDGYWYENGLTCKADSTGFLQWMTVSGNNNAQENVQEIRFDNVNRAKEAFKSSMPPDDWSRLRADG